MPEQMIVKVDRYFDRIQKTNFFINEDYPDADCRRHADRQKF